MCRSYLNSLIWNLCIDQIEISDPFPKALSHGNLTNWNLFLFMFTNFALFVFPESLRTGIFVPDQKVFLFPSLKLLIS
jgi:hypothetical protein